ncbi:MAG: hypothetical protein ACXWD5_18055 [Mycobacterium sp.]
MNAHSWRRVCAAAASSIFLTLLWAAPTLARPVPPGPPAPPVIDTPFLRNLQTATNFSADDSTSPKTVTATCPTGTVVVGTGFYLYPTAEKMVSSVVPTESSVTVTAAEDETGYSDDWSLTAHAYCAARPTNYAIVRIAGIASNTNPKTTSANCPSGTTVLGLGWSTADNYGFPVNSQLTVTEARAFTSTSRVTISVSEDDTGWGPQWSVDPIAICGTTSGVEIVTEVHPNPRGYEIGTPSCTDGRTAIGGGISMGQNPDVLFSGMYAVNGVDYFSGLPYSNSYVVGQDDEDGGGAWTLTSDVICAIPMPVLQL